MLLGAVGAWLWVLYLEFVSRNEVWVPYVWLHLFKAFQRITIYRSWPCWSLWLSKNRTKFNNIHLHGFFWWGWGRGGGGDEVWWCGGEEGGLSPVCESPSHTQPAALISFRWLFRPPQAGGAWPYYRSSTILTFWPTSYGSVGAFAQDLNIELIDSIFHSIKMKFQCFRFSPPTNETFHS